MRKRVTKSDFNIYELPKRELTTLCDIEKMLPPLEDKDPVLWLTEKCAKNKRLRHAVELLVSSILSGNASKTKQDEF